MRKVFIISWHKGGGKIHQLIFGTREEAESYAEKLMDREERDGIKREWIINYSFYIE